MKLKECFVTYENNKDDTIIMDSSAKFSGLAHSNRTAAFIIECLKSETTADEITEKMLEKYSASENQVKESIDTVLNALRKMNALDE